MKNRETRKSVVVKARMRVGNEWSDVSIRNVSSRGMMLCSEVVPPPGAYLEIRKAMMVVVARAVWARDGFFGVRTQDSIDFGELMDNAAARPVDRPPGSDRRAADRRAAHRPEESAERSRRYARIFQFCVLVLAIGTVAALLASEVWALLAVPLDTVRFALGG